MKEILLLMYAIDKPLQGKEIFERIGAKLSDKFSKWDLEIGKSNEPRWKKTAAFAFYRGLVPKKLVEAKTKNQWVLTDKGRTAAKEMMAEPKGLSLIELEELSNGLRVVVINVGNRPEQLTDFAVGDSGRKSLFHKKIAVEPGKRVELGLEVSPEMFKTGKPFDIRMWSDTGKEFRFKVPF